MSNSKKKLKVTVTNRPNFLQGKKWARVELLDGAVFYPSFEDLFRIIQAICHCEDLKYPNIDARVKVAKLLCDSTQKGMKWDDLAEKYQIPVRDGDKIIKDNGAAV